VSASKHAPSREGFVSSTSYDYIRPENRAAAALDREKIRQTTRADIEANVESGAYHWGSAKEVTEQMIEIAERAGANSLLVNMDLGAVPHEFISSRSAARARGPAAASGARGYACAPCCCRALSGAMLRHCWRAPE
jgi:hypothetical protein